MNLELWAALALIVVILVALGYEYFKKPKAQTADMATVAAALKPHIASMFAAARADAAKAGTAIAHEFHFPAASLSTARDEIIAAARQSRPSAMPAGTPADSGGTPSPEKAAMQQPSLRNPVGASSMFARQAPAPAAIQVLNDFKSYAAAVQLFLELKSEVEKWMYYQASPPLWKFQALLGVTPGWINAFDDSALINGQGVYTYLWDFAAKVMTTRTHQPVLDPAVTWRTGAPPAYYRPLEPTTRDGAGIVTAWLTEAMNLSASLVAHGLTEEAIAAARA